MNNNLLNNKLSFFLFLLFFSLSVNANYPEKPIKLIIAFPAGGGTDVLARSVSQKVVKNIGQNIVMENRAGADGNVGTEYVAAAKPDGYILLFSTNIMTINQNFYKDQKYDPVKDFAPIIRFGEHPYLLVINSALNVKTLSELIALSNKDKPLFYASSASNTSLALEGLKKVTGLKAERINFSGGPPATVAIISGEVQMMFTAPVNALEHIKAGKMRPLIISTSRRSLLLPEVPTVIETGIANYSDSFWLGLLAPVGVPKDIISFLNLKFSEALSDPELKITLENTGLMVSPNSAAEFLDLMKSDVKRFKDLVKTSGIVLK